MVGIGTRSRFYGSSDSHRFVVDRQKRGICISVVTCVLICVEIQQAVRGIVGAVIFLSVLIGRRTCRNGYDCVVVVVHKIDCADLRACCTIATYGCNAVSREVHNFHRNVANAVAVGIKSAHTQAVNSRACAGVCCVNGEFIGNKHSVAVEIATIGVSIIVHHNVFGIRCACCCARFIGVRARNFKPIYQVGACCVEDLHDTFSGSLHLPKVEKSGIVAKFIFIFADIEFRNGNGNDNSYFGGFYSLVDLECHTSHWYVGLYTIGANRCGDDTA